MRLWPALLYLAMATEFVPTHEWQLVPEDVAIPGGLDIRMDINHGGEWAKLSERNGAPAHGDSGEREIRGEKEIAIASLDLDQLPALEEEAHDYDDGAEIAQKHGTQLFELYKSGPQSELAGRILTVCLRNNAAAAKSLIEEIPDLLDIFTLQDRAISILSALVSTPPGAKFVQRSEVLPNIRRELAYVESMTPTLARNVRKLLQNLSVGGVDDEAMCNWVDALTQAYFTTKDSVVRETAVEIVEHAGDFENLKVQCRPQPGLLPAQREAKRAAETSGRLANPKAARNHFDEL